jgi:hypothetical protein
VPDRRPEVKWRIMGPGVMNDRILGQQHEIVGGSVKRSLAMALLGCDTAIAKACGLDAATRVNYSLLSYAILAPCARRSGFCVDCCRDIG